MSTSPLIRMLSMAAAVPVLLGAQVPAPRPQPAQRPQPATQPAIPLEPQPPMEPLVPMPPMFQPEPLLAMETLLPMEMPRLAELSLDMRHDLHLAETAMHASLEFAEARLAADEATRALRSMDLEHLVQWRGDHLLEARPRAPWAAEDPADSLYRLAREALNRGEYRRAAQLFSEVTRKYPTSRYAMDCAYWEAFARYRLGTTEELKLALQILDGKGAVALSPEAMARQGRPSSNSAIDIPALRARVQGALAARGDREAAAALQAEARQNTGCDREEVSVRAEALQALAQMDLQGTMPTVKKVLQRRDECTVELRRRALYILSRQPDAESAALVLDVAKNDPDENIRGEAMRVLPRVAGDNAIPQLEELLRTASDERSQRSAVSALASIDSDRARRAVRTIIERADAAERVRYDAILSLARERDGRGPTAEELAYLRALYTRIETPRLREAVLTALSRVESAENQQFLLAIVRNEREPTGVRATALQRLGRMESVSVDEIARLYVVADARSLREQILYALSRRKEPEAIDKLIEIARRDTDPQIRRTAISLLGRSNNERAKQLLKELIEK